MSYSFPIIFSLSVRCTLINVVEHYMMILKMYFVFFIEFKIKNYNKTFASNGHDNCGHSFSFMCQNFYHSLIYTLEKSISR